MQRPLRTRSCTRLSAKRGIFLAFTVEPGHAHDAEAKLLRPFPREQVSLQRLMLRAMRARAGFLKTLRSS
jgi:hypothetical protein